MTSSSGSGLENQYLRPDDLPITDAKKNPLALLAMTCSNIGADILGTGKSIINFERSGKKSRSEDSRSDSVISDKLQTNSIDSNRSNSRDSEDGDGRINHHQNYNNNINKSSSTSAHKISFKPYEDLSPSKSDGERKVSPSSRRTSPSDGAAKSSVANINHRHHESSKVSSSSNHPTDHVNNKTSSPAFSSAPIGHSSSLPHGNFLSGHSHVDGSGSGTCRDPYCPGCLSGLAASLMRHSSSSLSNGSACCPSFPHCIHQQLASVYAFPGHPAAAAAYASSLGLAASRTSFPNGAASSTTARPFLCHWTTGGSYCGKSFASCEELLQHLKSHTLSSNSSSSSSASSSAYPPLPPYSHTSSPASLFGSLSSRPTVSSMDSLRYHPYKLGSHAFASHLRSPPSSAMLSAPHAFSHPPTASPSMTVFHPNQHPSLGSFYTLLN